ncbi:FkbM family methyltransferase [Aurantimonas sp. VKM B-3413]|uniref:FkbM family methyltransferase n=1 Tax=Aurantimonas sp. VKM B-3413 TaxID=2779401 RepID=UPI001E593F43|nr:FkbM family methyltransferase [Aurantimonas sp. VKM B-3413]MCB8839398.1 FkbM family methyltransferase [Aurantimonas sp. VKM B-3413]
MEAGNPTIAPGTDRALAVGVTIFSPDEALLEALLGRLAGVDARLLAYVDGPVGTAIGADILERLRQRDGLELIEAPANAGIGAGLNALCAAAQAGGATHILLFDQDSSPEPGLAEALLARHRSLGQAGERPAVVGPQPVVPAGEDGKPPRYPSRSRERAGCRAVDYVITSGSLVDLAAFVDIGPFRADFFIDGIDLEWSLRAWAKGYSVWLDPALLMPHRLGHGVISAGPIRFPAQSEARMQSYLRNRVALMRLPHVPLRLKLRSLAYLPLQAMVYARRSGGWPVLRRFAAAARHGWAGQLGAGPSGVDAGPAGAQPLPGEAASRAEKAAMEIVTLHGLKVQVDRERDAPVIQRGIDRGWYEGDEVRLARAVIGPHDRVLELGGGMGVVTSALAGIVGDAAVLTYEPNPAVVERARANLSLNGHAVEIRQRLCRPASTGATHAAFRLAEVFWASGLDRGEAEGRLIEVAVDPLETVIATHRATILVMDIEGGELEILETADLSPLRAMIFETHEDQVGQEATNAAVLAACARGFLIDFKLTRDGVVVLRRKTSNRGDGELRHSA